MINAEIKIFQEHQIRIVPDNYTFWIVGKDVLNALDYDKDAHVLKTFKNIPDEWVQKKVITLKLYDGRIQERNMICLSEQVLYFFLARCDKTKSTAISKLDCRSSYTFNTKYGYL